MREYIRQDPRRAGDLERYHTWPHVREQSVAHHSWNIARIVLCIDREVSYDLLTHCLFHDLGEIASGDPPFPSKRDNPAFGRAHAQVEEAGRVAMCEPWGLPLPRDLSPEDRAIFKLAEFIEMAEWGIDEVTICGNRLAQPVIDTCLLEAEALMASDLVPLDVRKRAARYLEKRKDQIRLCQASTPLGSDPRQYSETNSTG